MAKRRPSCLKRWTSSTVVIDAISFGSLPHLGSAPSRRARPRRARGPPRARSRARSSRAYDKDRGPPPRQGAGGEVVTAPDRPRERLDDAPPAHVLDGPVDE